MKESQIQKTIVQYLQLLENQGKLYFIRNNNYAGFLSYNKKDFHYTRQGKKGCSDLIVFLPYNSVSGKCPILFIEVKSETGKQSDEQKEFEKKITYLGYRYCIVNSLDLMQIVLRDYDII